jgi:iron complex transport system permease protein
MKRQHNRGQQEGHIAPDEALCPNVGIAEEAMRVFDSKVSLKKKLVLLFALLAIVVASLCLGRYFSNPLELSQTIYEHFVNVFRSTANSFNYFFNIDAATLSPIAVTDPKLETAFFNIRVPRVIVVVLVGAALSLAGASYQGMFKNPLVSPDLLGASAGAAFGACLGLLLNCPNILIQLLAFAGGMAAVGCVMALNKAIRADALLSLILGGILVSTLFSSGTSLVKLLADADDKLPAITFWLMGSFAGVTVLDLLLLLPLMLIGFSMLLSQRWNLNVLSFGEDEARSLGINTTRTRLVVIFAATLLTACSVAVSGMIGWIGLVVPHLARSIVGPNYRVLLPTTIFVGAAFLLIVDNVSRLLFSVEIPIGLLTSILGVPFFVFIYRRKMKGW